MDETRWYHWVISHTIAVLVVLAVLWLLISATAPRSPDPVNDTCNLAQVAGC